MDNKLKYLLMVVLFVFLTVLGYWMIPKEEEVEHLKEDRNDDFIFVHIEGQVEKPGLIKVKNGTRMYELIEEAGGETENADLSRINLASIVSDEQKVVVPAKVIVTDESSLEEGTSFININTASKEKLMTLNGIGEGTAEKIIQYRQEIGYFNSIEDLKNVSGIGENKFNGLKDDITI